MILLNRYQLLKGYGDHDVSVGFGSYGQVKLAKDLKTNENVAVKIVHKLAENQVVFHNQLYHPNVIQLLGHYIDREKQTTYMVLEYADGGTLFDKIKTEVLPKKDIKNYFRDVCEAIAYLHSNQIMHRDIKPQNILLTNKSKAKLCDFGFAAILGERKTLCGTYQYMSPEMIQNRPYDYKIDIWALGILLFELIAGRAPFRGNSPDEVLNQMKTKIFFGERFTTQEINLVKCILRVTPSKRPTIKQILEHPYFAEQDTTSTKQSEMESSRIQKQIQQPNTQKVQQNSYPMYVPKAQNKPIVEPEGFQRPISNYNPQTGQHIPLNFKPGNQQGNQPKQGLNNTFTGYSMPNQIPPYRRS